MTSVERKSSSKAIEKQDEHVYENKEEMVDRAIKLLLEVCICGGKCLIIDLQMKQYRKMGNFLQPKNQTGSSSSDSGESKNRRNGDSTLRNTKIYVGDLWH